MSTFPKKNIVRRHMWKEFTQIPHENLIDQVTDIGDYSKVLEVLHSWETWFKKQKIPFCVTKENGKYQLWKEVAPTCGVCGLPYMDMDGTCRPCAKGKEIKKNERRRKSK